MPLLAYNNKTDGSNVTLAAAAPGPAETLLPGVIRPPGPDWLQGSSGPAGAHQGGMLVYDSGRSVFVFFGGLDGANSPQGETWEYNVITDTWTQIMISGPPARGFGAMIYDAARNRTVLFGGYDGNSVFGDTWEYDTATWTQNLAGGGPSARYAAAAVFDSTRNKMVIVGGFDGGSFHRETWEFDGAWTNPSNVGPSGRFGAMAAYDQIHNVTVLFGGFDGTQPRDTWTWNGTTWTRVALNVGPSGRALGAAVFNTAKSTVFLFGGTNLLGGPGNDNNEAWEWNGFAWSLDSQGNPPSARDSFGLAYATDTGQTVLSGGADGSGGSTNDTWSMTIGVAQLIAPKIYDVTGGVRNLDSTGWATLQAQIDSGDLVLQWREEPEFDTAPCTPLVPGSYQIIQDNNTDLPQQMRLSFKNFKVTNDQKNKRTVVDVVPSPQVTKIMVAGGDVAAGTAGGGAGVHAIGAIFSEAEFPVGDFFDLSVGHPRFAGSQPTSSFVAVCAIEVFDLDTGLPVYCDSATGRYPRPPVGHTYQFYAALVNLFNQDTNAVQAVLDVRTPLTIIGGFSS